MRLDFAIGTSGTRRDNENGRAAIAAGEGANALAEEQSLLLDTRPLDAEDEGDLLRFDVPQTKGERVRRLQ